MISYLFFALGLLFESLLLVRIHQGRMWRRYPFFCVYLGYDFSSTFILYYLLRYHFGLYEKLYWRSEFVSVILYFFVIREVFRHTFPKWLTIYKVVSKVLLGLLFALAIAFFMASQNLDTFYRPESFYPDFERKLACAQALLLGVIFLAARYYQVSLGRNLWGIGVGFGIYAFISLADFAVFELAKSFFSYWQLIQPASFVVMLGVWTWALWVYAPNPILARDAPEDPRLHLSVWRQAWNRMLFALRKVLEQ